MATGRPGVVLGNGAEADPLNLKDKVLMRAQPHLVLDGLEIAAALTGARSVAVVVSDPESSRTMRSAVAERVAARYDRAPAEVIEVAPTYLGGEETALMAGVEGRPALPRFKLPRPTERGVGGRPTLVQNVETLANFALIARFGAAWFRRAGNDSDPGTALVSVFGAVTRPGVREVELGSRLLALSDEAGASLSRPVLIGGTGGVWLDPTRAASAELTAKSLGAYPSSVVVLPDQACPLAETARLVAYLRSGSARQCGPCTNGLPLLADTISQLAFMGQDPKVRGRLDRLCGLIANRGACHLPDGAIRLVKSALTAFSDEVDLHIHRGPCAGATISWLDLSLRRLGPSGERGHR
jgi:NADH:ubiquinone oxidoreductase subunit F (NADH-binding)